MTPGMGIGVATPGHHLPPVAEDGAPLDKNASHLSRNSVDKNGDYFSSTLISQDPVHKPAVTPTPAPEAAAATEPKSPTDEKENGKEGLFGKKFRMGMSFGSKKIGRSASSATEKPVVVDEKAEDGSETSENGEKEKEVDDNFGGIVQRIRYDYEKFMAEHIGQPVESGITPSLPNETPVLKPPPMTTVIIQEETKGGSADLYRGTVATVGQDANLIESRAPWWLGDLLLRVCNPFVLSPRALLIVLQNRTPLKDPVKVSFVLHPWQDTLPSIAGPDGNSRLNANRMLRVKKILGYVAERIDPNPDSDPNALKPEEYLELYCYDQVRIKCPRSFYMSSPSEIVIGALTDIMIQKLPVTMTLATLRAHVWKGGNDVLLYYKSNGKKSFEVKKTVPEAVPANEEGVPANPVAN